MSGHVHQAGFSLLEVLMALGILAGASAAILSAAGSQMLTQADDEMMSRAVFLARNKMVNIEAGIAADLAKAKFPQEVEDAGRFDEPFEDYYWEVTIKKVEIPLVSQGGKEQSGYAQRFLKTLMDDISKKVRELKLTVYWGSEFEDSEERQEVVVTTHIVNLN